MKSIYPAEMVGITADGYVIYLDDVDLYAQYVYAPTPSPIRVLSPAVTYAQTIGNYLFYWDPPWGVRVGRLGIWSTTLPFTWLADSSLVGVAAVSPDGTRAIFTSNVTSYPSGSCDILGIDLTDTKKQPTLVKGVSAGAFGPVLAFVGSGGSATAVAVYSTTRGSPTSGSLTSFGSTSSWASTALLTNVGVPAVSADASGASLFAIDSSGNGLIVPTNGASTTAIDANVQDGAILPDGSAVVYVTNAGDLMRAATASPVPTLLSSGGFDRLRAWPNPAPFSPDGQWVFLERAGTMWPYDAELASTSTAGSAREVAKYANESWFTADSKFALLNGGNSPMSSNLMASAVTGAAVETLAKVPTGAFYALSGSQCAWGATDKIYVQDLSSGAAPTVIADYVDRRMLVTPARDGIVYYSSKDPRGKGLYFAAIH